MDDILNDKNMQKMMEVDQELCSFLHEFEKKHWDYFKQFYDSAVLPAVDIGMMLMLIRCGMPANPKMFSYKINKEFNEKN